MVAIKSETSGANQAELLIRCCTEIVRELLEAHHESRPINLNALKTKVAKKYKCNVVARLVDIIAAVPQEARDILLPKLRAKPVRTASGVSEDSQFEREGALLIVSRRRSLSLLSCRNRIDVLILL